MASSSILFVSADPSDYQRLRIDEERRQISEELRLAGHGKVPMASISAARTSDLQRSLLDFSPKIVHFSGHGVGSEGLVFQDLFGRSQLVHANALASLFKLFSTEGLECVVLNACYSIEQAEVISKKIDFVVGMNEEIGDAAAIKFSIGFYQAIGAGRSIEFAYEFGRAAIQMEGIPEHLTPVLYKSGELVYEYSKPVYDEPLTRCPKGFEIATTQVLEACEKSCPYEEIRLIEWKFINDSHDIFALFRERNRGRYFQLLLEDEFKEISYRPLPFCLPLISPTELEWQSLTQNALPEDWHALDEIIRLGLAFPGSKVLLADKFTIGEPVCEDALEQFGLYIPDEHLLPAFVFVNKLKGLVLLSFFKSPDGFGRGSSVSDEEECRNFGSLKEAQVHLSRKLSQ